MTDGNIGFGQLVSHAPPFHPTPLDSWSSPTLPVWQTNEWARGGLSRQPCLSPLAVLVRSPICCSPPPLPPQPLPSRASERASETSQSRVASAGGLTHRVCVYVYVCVCVCVRQHHHHHHHHIIVHLDAEPRPPANPPADSPSAPSASARPVPVRCLTRNTMARPPRGRPRHTPPRKCLWYSSSILLLSIYLLWYIISAVWYYLLRLDLNT